MVVVYPDLLSPEERARLYAMLDEEPLVAEPWRPWSPGLWAAVVMAAGLAAVFVGLVDPLGEREPVGFLQAPFGQAFGIGIASLFAAASLAMLAALLTAMFRGWRAAVAVSHTPHRCGRFLFRFGYVESQPGRVAIIPGREILDVDVRMGEPALTGASDIVVALSGDGWTRRLVIVGCDLDVSRDAIDAVRRAEWAVADGYRSVRTPFASHRARFTRDESSLVGHVAVVGAATLGFLFAWTAVLPARALHGLERTRRSSRTIEAIAAVYPWPWVRDAVAARVAARYDTAREELAREVAAPWRASLTAMVDEAQRGGAPFVMSISPTRCEWTPAVAREIDRWTLAHASGPDVATLDGLPRHGDRSRWLARLRRVLGEAVTWPGGAAIVSTAPASLAVDCRLTPTEAWDTPDGRTYAAVRVDATLRLRVHGRSDIVATASYEPRELEPGRWDSPYYLWDEAATFAIDQQLYDAVFVAP